MLTSGAMKQLYEMRGEGNSIRGIARELGISRNSIRKYPCQRRGRLSDHLGYRRSKLRSRHRSKLDPYTEFVTTTPGMVCRPARCCCEKCGHCDTTGATRF